MQHEPHAGAGPIHRDVDPAVLIRSRLAHSSRIARWYSAVNPLGRSGSLVGGVVVHEPDRVQLFEEDGVRPRNLTTAGVTRRGRPEWPRKVAMRSSILEEVTLLLERLVGG